MGDLYESASSRRASTHSGSRGETATDAAQRYLEVGTEKMLREVKELICDLAGSDGFVLLGGEQEALAALRPMMSSNMDSRLLENGSLWLEMSAAEVKKATAEAASELSKRRQERLLDQIVAQAYSRGKGCLGGKETVRALDSGSVDTLILSKGFVETNPDFADVCVHSALEQGAGSVHWRSACFDTPLLLVFGHEREGVGDDLLELADEIAELPVRGITNSLNVALCASAVLYEVLERERPGGTINDKSASTQA